MIIQWNGLRIHVCLCLIALLALVILVRRKGFLVKCHLLSIGLLLGSVSFFLQEASHVVPALMFKPEILNGIFIGMGAFALTRQAASQIFCISVGLILGEIFFAYMHGPHGYHSVLGGAKFQDKWWLSVWTALGCAALWQSVHARGKLAVKFWTERRKGGPHDRMDR